MDEFPHHGHRGPVTRGCPPECLLDVLSRKAWNPLMRGGNLTDPPKTIGDVLNLYARNLLKEIDGLGSRRIGEIEAALVLAGFDLAAYRNSCMNGRNARKPGLGDKEGRQDSDQRTDPRRRGTR